MNTDGTGQTGLTSNSAHDEAANWSSDSTKIAFNSDRDGNFEVYGMNADGTGQTNLTNNSAYDDWPKWSPDGTKMVFRSVRDGNSEIYVMNADGSNQTNLTNNSAEDVRPDWQSLHSSIILVEIDIKPGEEPNSINPKSKGVIPVAILTTAAFDATTVDPLSVRFGPAGAAEAHNQGHIEDVDGDGDQDLVLHFRTQHTGIQCGDTSASLNGETFGGQVIEGSDTINTVRC
jgi:dipeptidyl aminopeptidase/acylaminoacyl peptidase